MPINPIHQHIPPDGHGHGPLPILPRAILNGSRDSAIADDHVLDVANVAEVLFLIERLDGE